MNNRSSSSADRSASESRASSRSPAKSRHSRGGGSRSRTYSSSDDSHDSLSNPPSLGSAIHRPRSSLPQSVTSNNKRTPRFSLKNVRKSLASASFSGMCQSNTPKMKFSKLNSPELEALSFPSSEHSGDDDDDASSMGRSLQAIDEDGQEVTTNNNSSTKPGSVPLHTCALIAGLAAFFMAKLPTLQSLDQVANIDTFTHTVLESVPLSAVIATRLAFAAIMLGNALNVFLYGDWEADTDYFPGSTLKPAQRISFKGAMVKPGGSLFGGLKCISTFTMWCWIVEGAAFFLAGMIPLFHYVPGVSISPWIFRLSIVLWEIGAPISILVSAVVKYALWPMATGTANVRLLQHPSALLQHNLNSIAALLEVGLLGGLPVRLSDFALMPLYGMVYLLFTYGMMNKWTKRRHKGPQFFYPFLDPTLGFASSLFLLALLAILSLGFVLFVATQQFLQQAEHYIAIIPIGTIVILTTILCRVKD